MGHPARCYAAAGGITGIACLAAAMEYLLLPKTQPLSSVRHLFYLLAEMNRLAPTEMTGQGVIYGENRCLF
jgi:hypothetical protein